MSYKWNKKETTTFTEEITKAGSLLPLEKKS